MNEAAHHLLTEQLATWKTARDNYHALRQVRTRTLTVAGIPYRVQFNPARIVSSAAKTDSASIARRPCFLCPACRPEQQRSLHLSGHYELLVNPYPIFPEHFTIAEQTHTPQSIATRFADLLQMARRLSAYTLFYNGPRCGASAPDHAHFQAIPQGVLPIEAVGREQRHTRLALTGDACLYSPDRDPRSTLAIEAGTVEDACRLFRAVYDALPVPDGENEPRMNLLARYSGNTWKVIIFPRKKHRPACYEADGDARLLCSPASVDLAGVLILPREEDYRKITEADILQILHEVCLPPDELNLNRP